MRDLQDRFRGCLIGLAVGDCLGAAFEGQPGPAISARFSSPAKLFARAIGETLYYTDDTQMMIGVAEALLADGEIREATLCRQFVANYVPARGYGRGARRILDAIERGRDYNVVAEEVFPGGSYGNGAAMRVAPVGLLFTGDPQRIDAESAAQALPTHRHPLGIQGAQLIAAAVAAAMQAEAIDKQSFLLALRDVVKEPTLIARLDQATAQSATSLVELGNGITAQESVVTAIACFVNWPESFVDAVGNAILLGGDTDTIAAMTGAISGAFLGYSAIPASAIQALENEGKGRDYILSLANQLFDRHNLIFGKNSTN